MYWSTRDEDAPGARTAHRVHVVLPVARTVRLAPTTVGPQARATITPGMMRAWLAAWCLTERWDRAHPTTAGLGYFTLDVRAVLHDLYGLPTTTRRVGGKTYARPPVSAERSFLAQFERLQALFLRGVGQGMPRLEARDPERLITFLRDGEGRGKVYRHATLAVTVMRHTALQMPTAALRLGPDDTPMALGLAALWRDHIRQHVFHIRQHVLRGPGRYQVSLRGLAEQIGEAWRQGVENYNAGPYWARLVARIERVMREGEFGTMHLQGEGSNALLTLTPSDVLVTVYRSLAQTPLHQRTRGREPSDARTLTRRKPARGHRRP